MKGRCFAVGLLALLLIGGSNVALANDVALQGRVSDWREGERRVDDRRMRYLVGLSVQNGAGFLDEGGRSWGAKPSVAMEWGRLRLSSGGGRGLLNQGLLTGSVRGGGLEGLLQSTDRFNLGLSLNLDRGRSALHRPGLQTAPPVPTTLRMRVRMRYAFSPRWNIGLAASQDILGRGGGLRLDTWLGYELPLTERTRLSAGVGASAGNSQYLRSEYGLPAAAGMPAYRPHSSLHQLEAGFDIAHSVSRHWVVFGGVRSTRLRGAASRSPLVERKRSVDLSVGLAWRN